MISKYKQSDWFSRFLVMLSQQAQDFGRSAPDPYPMWRRGLGTRLGSTLYVGLAHAVSPINTNFRLTFLLTRLQEALYEDLAVYRASNLTSTITFLAFNS